MSGIKKARKHNSPIAQRILDRMEKDPWYVKLARWYRVKKWMYICRTRFLWDKSFEGYIFRAKKN